MKLIMFNLRDCKRELLFEITDEYVMEKEIWLLGKKCRFIVKLINAFQVEVRKFKYFF